MMKTWETLLHTTEKGTDDWRTPREFFEKLNSEFNFVIDAAASAQNAMLPRFWTKEDDALSKPWHHEGGAIWCNPPYGRDVGRWVRKAWEESQNGATVVMLIFARTDTAWWHDWAVRATEIVFVRGRLRFERPDGTRGAPAPVPSVLLYFRGHDGTRS